MQSALQSRAPCLVLCVVYSVVYRDVAEYMVECMVEARVERRAKRCAQCWSFSAQPVDLCALGVWGIQVPGGMPPTGFEGYFLYLV